MSVYKIIQELRGTRSKNEKEAIIRREQDNTELKEFFRLALNPFIKFYQKKDFWIDEHFGTNSLTDAMEFLVQRIASREITGYEAEAAIVTTLESLTEEDAEVIKLILKKDPDCGVQTTIDKVWVGLIPSYPCLLASPWSDKLAMKMPWKTGVIMQKKSDGLRCNLHIDEEGTVKAFTRAGNELNVHGHFDCLGVIRELRGFVVDGELLTFNQESGKFNNRQTSNGICNKAVRGTMSKQESEQLHLVCWDLIHTKDFATGSGSVPYNRRLKRLQNIVEFQTMLKWLWSVVETETVYEISHAQEFYQRMLSEGEEGAMAKDPSDWWSDKRLKTILKLKSEATADVRVVGWKAGTDALEGNLGSLIVQTEDGKCVTNMSGFPLKLRSEIFANLTNLPVEYKVVNGSLVDVLTANPGDCDVKMDSIVEVLYNQKIMAKDSQVWKLFLPRFSQNRHDKTIANTLEELV
jgi:hypothetical protein